MSEDRKIIEKEGLKYYKEKGQWYQISPIEEGKVPVDIKTQKLMKLNLLPEIQLDVFKCLSFTQLLVVQQTNVYFKNFVNEHGKVLAMKKFDKLEILPISDSTINRYQEHKPVPKLYDFELEEHRFCDFGMCEQKYKFFKPEPRLYEFELSEELEKKWKYGIKNSIPMFLTSLTPYVNTNIVVCELEQNDKLEKGLYYFQLSKYPKNIEEMKIARYFFQLLFNCSFTFFDIHLAIINPQMLELLFVDEIARNVLLQIHTQETDLMFYDDHPLNIVRNHLVANEFNIEFGKRFDFDVEKKADVVLEILANGGDKFSNIYLEYLHSKLYNLIIEHIVASQDITKMVKKIHFEGMYGPLISSENAINLKIEVIDNIKITKFQLVNKYNSKIVFFVSVKQFNKIHAPGQENCETGVDAKIRRIKLFFFCFTKMSEDRKIIEHDGLKYYKQEGQWYQISPIDEDKVPVDIKIKKRMKLNLLPEIQLDVFKCLSFTQLLVVQQASVYFKNFISENEKVLAMKKFCRLEINLVNDETISCYKKCKQDPNLYDFKLEEHRPCDSGMCEKTFKFFKLKPQLYEFELSKRLEIKWKSAIEEPIPMFLTSDNELIRVDEDANTVDCKLERNYKQEKGSTYNELYYFQLSKFPKNVEEMKIARYFFQLLFNCTFDYFVVCNVIINPQMIDLLFDNDITTNKHLQIHSKDTQILSCDEHYLTFAWNHLVSNELLVEIYETFEEENLDILFKILANGGNKFSYIIYQFSNSKLYNFIIEHIETSQDISKMVKKIEFWRMHGSLISSERAKNVEIKEEEEGKKETKFQLVNKHNPKIEFSVLIKEGRTFNLTYSEDYDTLVPAVDAVIERIN